MELTAEEIALLDTDGLREIARRKLREAAEIWVELPAGRTVFDRPQPWFMREASYAFAAAAVSAS